MQTAIKLILEAIFEADFQEGSYGFRPKRNQHQAVNRVKKAIVENKTIAIGVDLENYFDTIRHHILLEKIAKRVDDKEILKIIKFTLKLNGKKGVGQGSPLAPLFSNLYLNEVDKMLEKAKIVTSKGKYTNLEYTRFADDLLILISTHYSQRWLVEAVEKRMKGELEKIEVKINTEKTQIINLNQGKHVTFLGFDIRRVKSRYGKWFPLTTPKMKSRTKLLRKIKPIFKKYRSQPIGRIIKEINPILRGWVNYYRIGNSSKCFMFIKDWVIQKLKKHLNRSRQIPGFGWKKWSTSIFYSKLGLFNNYVLVRL